MESGRKDSRTPTRKRVGLVNVIGKALGVRLSLLALLLRDFSWFENVTPARLPESQVTPAGARGRSREPESA